MLQFIIKNPLGANFILNLSSPTLDTLNSAIFDVVALPTNLQKLSCSSQILSSNTNLCSLLSNEISLSAFIRGGQDSQDRVGSKFGGGGVMSADLSARDRKERLRQLALETIDLNKDPYFMRNHLGSYECKLCLTLHGNEGNYLAHTQGKKHQANLGKRAFEERKREEEERLRNRVMNGIGNDVQYQRPKSIKIGRPGYSITKSIDSTTGQKGLSFELHYDRIDKGIQPRHRFMSAFEQRQEPPDKNFQYLLFAATPYDNIGFKIPNERVNKERFVTSWRDGVFTCTFYFEGGGGGGEGGDVNVNVVATM